ncbi:autotransporter outer membrane beta-barrel domain-containing protein [Halocynthiibacter namhaensis]|uniref:autotransporter outer membrane beta-barrel domain-containing protein n=1 Tax=Halocynthiibacter namhaensis TaxID=1290553 RepID=UPI00138E19E8|nr:autotransporter outer membrane beta-barrel domain-containing protein [Halocynthiibacter namhaensis]
MTKFKGVAASIAPMVGVGAVVIGGLTTGQVSAANECGATANGMVSCTTTTYVGSANDIDYAANGIVLTIDLNGTAVGGINAEAGAGQGNAAQGPAGSFDIVINAQNAGMIGTSNTDASGIRSNITNANSGGAAIVTMGDGHITTAGLRGRGIFARQVGLGNAMATMSGGTIDTTGIDAYGVRAFIRNSASQATASVAMTGGTIDTSAAESRGLYATNEGLGNATATLNEANGASEITTAGDNAHGIQAEVDNVASAGIAEAEMSGGEIDTDGNDAVGVYALNAGLGDATVMLSGSSTIQTDGSFAHGALANITNTNSNANAIVTMGSGVITTVGDGARGVFARQEGLGNAMATMSGGTIDTTGEHAYGVRAFIRNSASTATASVVMSGGTINTGDDGSRGLYATNEGLGDVTATLNGAASVIETTGDNAHGVQAEIDNAVSTATAAVNMTGGSIATSGVEAAGLYALNLGDGDATVTASGGAISTGVTASADLAHGAFAQTDGDGDATVTLMQTTITTDGDFAFGAFSDVTDVTSTGDALVTMTDGSITTDGYASRGLFARNDGEGNATVVLNGAGASITTLGDHSYGLLAKIRNANSGGDVAITMNGGEVTTDLADGIRAETNGTGQYDVNVTGGKVVSGSGSSAGIHTIAAAGGTIDIAAGVTIDSSASNVAIRDGDADQDGIDEIGGDVVVTTAGDITGDALLGAGNDTFNLVGGSFTGDIQADDAVSAGTDKLIWSGGTLNGGFYGGDGSDTAVISASASFAAATVLDGGVDASADSLTFDGLTAVVTGGNILNWETITVDGANISFTDTALTVGSGGLSIENSGVLDGGSAFALTGDLVIDNGSRFVSSGTSAGVYTFSGDVMNDGQMMLQNGVSGDMVTIAGDYSGTGALLVDLDTSIDSSDALIINGTYTGPTMISVNSLSGNATGNDIRVITAAGGTSVTNFTLAGGSLSIGAFDYTLGGVGNDIVLQGAVNSTGAMYEAAPVVLGGFNDMTSLQQRIAQRQWGTEKTGLSGAWLRIAGDRTDVTTSSNVGVDSNKFSIQAGVDYAIDPSATGQWVFGATAQYGKISGDIAAALGTGSIDAEGFGLGATATWYGSQGMYVDIQGQFNSVSSDYTSSANGLRAEGVHSRTYALSVETGKRIALDADRTLVPQAQLTWGTVDGGSFTDDFGTSVNLGNNESLIARLGLAYEFKDSSAVSGRDASYYVIGNLMHDFSAGNKVSVGGVDFASEAGANWGEVGMGMSLALSEGTKIYGESSYRREFGGDGRGLGLSAGLNIQW